MTIHHLRIFAAVADCGSMRKAAKQLFISQPAISLTIRELEQHYGILLFERLHQKLSLTPVGERLLAQARHLLASYDALELQWQTAGQFPLLRIGATITIGICLLNRWLDRLETLYPALETNITVHNTTVIENMVASSRLDVGIVEGPVTKDFLTCRTVFTDQLLLLAGKTHPFYGQDTVDLEQLQGRSLIAREKGSTGMNNYVQALAERGVHMKCTWQCANTEAIKNAVIAGRGLGVLSNLLVRRELENGSLFAVPVEGMRVMRPLSLIYHSDKFLSPSLSAFLSICDSEQCGE